MKTDVINAMEAQFLKLSWLIFFITSAAFCEIADGAETSPRSALYGNVHPVQLTHGTLAAELGLGLGDRWALGLEGSYTDPKVHENGVDGVSLGMTGYYFFESSLVSTPYLKSALEGGFLNAGSKDSPESKNNKSTLLYYGQLKLLVGYHFMVANGVNINIGGGVNYLRTDVRTKGDQDVELGFLRTSVPNRDYSGFIPNAELNLGVVVML